MAIELLLLDETPSDTYDPEIRGPRRRARNALRKAGLVESAFEFPVPPGIRIVATAVFDTSLVKGEQPSAPLGAWTWQTAKLRLTESGRARVAAEKANSKRMDFLIAEMRRRGIEPPPSLSSR